MPEERKDQLEGSHGVFTGDQDAWDQMPEEYKAHLVAAFVHKARAKTTRSGKVENL